MVLSQYRSIKTTELQYTRLQKKLSKQDMNKIDLVLSKMEVDKSIGDDRAEERDKDVQVDRHRHGLPTDSNPKDDEQCNAKGEVAYSFPIDTLATPLVLQPQQPQQPQQPSKKGDANAYGFEIEPLVHQPKRTQQHCKAIVIDDDGDDDVVIAGDSDDSEDDDALISAALSYVPPDIEGKVAKKKTTPKPTKKDAAPPKDTATSKSTAKPKVTFICIL